MAERLLVDLGEAAKALSISRRSVQELVYRRVLASVRVGRCRRIAVQDLEDYVLRLREGEGFDIKGGQRPVPASRR